MRKFKNVTILFVCVSLLFVSGQIAPVSSQEMPTPGPKPEELIKPPIPCPRLPIAAIRDAQIIEASGGTVGFARLRLSWTYGPQEKPYKLLITVYRKQGTPPTWQNIMPESRPFEVIPPTSTTAGVTIFRLFAGEYKIDFTAYYSCNRKRVYSFERRI